MQAKTLILLLALLPAALCAASDEPHGPAKCGLARRIAPEDAAFFAGVKEAAEHAWPWVVSLRLNGSHHCGGSIVNESWVVTAAECVQGRDSALLSVEAGRHCRDCARPDVQLRTVAKVIVHPEYDANYTEHDLAMLRLAEPFLLGENVSHICLASSPVLDSATCFLAGWAGTAAGNGSSFLRQASLPIVPNTLCGDPDHYGTGGISKRMLCAGYDNGVNFCAGDFGGPLMCKSPDNGQWFLQGVLSAGDSCDNPMRPLVFTRVHEYFMWIIVDAITLAS